MKAIYKLILFLCLPLVHHSQSADLPEIINKIEALPEIDRQKAASELLQSYKGPIPHVYDEWAIFLYSGPADRVSVPGDFNGWSPTADAMSNIKGTDVWYLHKVFDPAARLDYKLSIDQDEWILDPRNPDQVMGGFGPNSSLSMPLYRPSPDYLDRKDIAKGTLHEKFLTSESTGKEFRIQVYLPAGYEKHNSVYPTVYFNDGSDYLDMCEAKTILDNLIFDGDIPPVVALFIDPNDRMSEYGGKTSDDYMHFILANVIPWVESVYPKVYSNPDHRVMIGTSLGGNITTLLTYGNPLSFRKAGIHSPAYGYEDGKALNLLRSTKESPVSGYFVIGTYEGWGPQKLQNLKELIRSPAINGKFVMMPQGHNWGLWRDTLGDMLRYLLGGKY